MWHDCRKTALTAASVYAIQFLMIAIGVGTAVGLNALLSRKLGAEKAGGSLAATTGLFLMLGTSLVFTLVGPLFSNRIAAALTNDPESAAAVPGIPLGEPRATGRSPSEMLCFSLLGM